jgi:hypothetical protein
MDNGSLSVGRIQSTIAMNQPSMSGSRVRLPMFRVREDEVQPQNRLQGQEFRPQRKKMRGQLGSGG